MPTDYVFSPVQVAKKIEHGTTADGQDKPPPRARGKRSCNRWSFDLFLRVWQKEENIENKIKK